MANSHLLSTRNEFLEIRESVMTFSSNINDRDRHDRNYGSISNTHKNYNNNNDNNDSINKTRMGLSMADMLHISNNPNFNNTGGSTPWDMYDEHTSNNSTAEPDYYDTDAMLDPDTLLAVHCVFIVLSALVLVAGLLGNCLVWFAVWRNPRMRSATNIFLVNLSVADFLVILVCLPPTMTEDITGIWYLGREMCKIVKCLQNVSVFVSVLTLTALSLERWMAICTPLMFRQTTVRAKRAVAIVWALSLGLAIPDAIALDLLPVTETASMCGPAWSEEAATIHLWIIFVVFYITPLCIMTFTYIKVALCLWRSGFTEDDDDTNTKPSPVHTSIPEKPHSSSYFLGFKISTIRDNIWTNNGTWRPDNIRFSLDTIRLNKIYCPLKHFV